jgi:hypothetical protein
MRKFYRDCLRVAKNCGVKNAKIEEGHRHPKVVGTVGGRSFACGISCSPGDKGAVNHARREIVKRVNELEGGENG